MLAIVTVLPTPDAELLELGRRFAEFERQIGTDNGTEIADAMQPIADRAICLPANTIEGLAVKATIARHFCGGLWEVESDDDCDWDKLLARRLIESTLKTARLRRSQLHRANK